MSTAIKILKGRFGRIALLNMDGPLVMHAHPHCHVLLKASGEDTCFQVRDRAHPLRADSAVLVNAWEPHAYAHRSSEAPPTVILALYIEPEWLTDIQQNLYVSSHPGFFPKPCVPINSAIRRLADNLAMEMLCSDEIPPMRLEALLFDLMIAVIDPFSEWRNMGALVRARLRQSQDFRIRRAIEQMRHNLGQINLDELAGQSSLSRSHFFALFRRCTGLTPNVYSNVLRMETAIRRLNDRVSLAELSLDLGFSAQSHFTRFFRQHLGITPSDYRQKVALMESELPKIGLQGKTP